MKTKLQSLSIGVALLAGVHQTTAQVTNLGIAPAPGGQSVLYWPVSPTNYVLQTVTNLTSTNWTTARTAYTVNAGEVTNSAPSGFFRLQPVTVPTGSLDHPGDITHARRVFKAVVRAQSSLHCSRFAENPTRLALKPQNRIKSRCLLQR